MEYVQDATAHAFIDTVSCARIDHFNQLESQTLADALAAQGVDLVTGPRVLDVGCGDGRLSRRLSERGAVCCGCDSSEAMIAAARATQPSAARPIEYYFADAASDAMLPGAGAYDLVLSAYVLHLAATEEKLQAMCCFLAQHARPGTGVVVVLTVSGEYVPEARQCELMTKCWGFCSERAADADTGGRVEFVMGSGSKAVRVVNYQYPEATYLQCLERAGFEDVEVWPMRAPPQLLAWARQVQEGGAAAGKDGGVWASPSESERAEVLLRYLSNPHVKGFIARKRGG